MAREKKMLTADDFQNPNISVTTTSNGTLQFRDGNGKMISRDSALQREYSWQYRQRNPDTAKESSRKYAARIRAEAKEHREEQQVEETADVS